MGDCEFCRVTLRVSITILPVWVGACYVCCMLNAADPQDTAKMLHRVPQVFGPYTMLPSILYEVVRRLSFACAKYIYVGRQK